MLINIFDGIGNFTRSKETNLAEYKCLERVNPLFRNSGENYFSLGASFSSFFFPVFLSSFSGKITLID
jgi:hypothetical protein